MFYKLFNKLKKYFNVVFCKLGFDLKDVKY